MQPTSKCPDNDSYAPGAKQEKKRPPRGRIELAPAGKRPVPGEICDSGTKTRVFGLGATFFRRGMGPLRLGIDDPLQGMRRPLLGMSGPFRGMGESFRRVSRPRLGVRASFRGAYGAFRGGAEPLRAQGSFRAISSSRSSRTVRSPGTGGGFRKERGIPARFAERSRLLAEPFAGLQGALKNVWGFEQILGFECRRFRFSGRWFTCRLTRARRRGVCRGRRILFFGFCV